MEWEERMEKFEEILEDNKPKLSKRQDKNLDDILFTGSELGLFEGLTVKPDLALKIISIYEYIKKNNKIENFLIL